MASTLPFSASLTTSCLFFSGAAELISDILTAGQLSVCQIHHFQTPFSSPVSLLS